MLIELPKIRVHFLFCFYSLFAWAGNQTLNFGNGAKISMNVNNGWGVVYYGRVRGKTEISKKKVMGSTGVTRDEDKFIMVDTEEGIFIIHETGKWHLIPASEKFLIQEEGYSSSADEKAYGKRNYILISVSYKSPENGNTGETYIVRDDGTALFHGYRYLDLKPEHVHINNGILSIAGEFRKIDLEAWDAERNFKPRPLEPIKKTCSDDDEGCQLIENSPLDWARRLFVDMAEEVRRPSSTVFSAVSESAISDIRIGLQRREAGNVVLVGESGSGKTQLARSFVKGIVTGKYREVPRTLYIPIFDSVGLNQGASRIGVTENRILALKLLAGTVPTLVFSDEIHSVRGVGTHSNNTQDVFQYIKPELADGSIKMLGTSTSEEFHAGFSGDPALLRRFSLVSMPPIDEKAVQEAIENWLKKFNLPPLKTEVARRAIELSSRYSVSSAFPGKVTALLDFAYAMTNIKNGNNKELTLENLNEAAQRFYSVDPRQFDHDAAVTTAAGISAALDESLVGIEWYKKALIESAQNFLLRLRDKEKPGVRLLVSGIPGTGKTEGAIAFAKYMNLPWRRFEMARYALSAPEVFLRELATELRKHPFTVAILDEIEKASLEVQEALLSVFDRGEFTVPEFLDTTERKLRFTTVRAHHAIFIGTTNAGKAFIPPSKPPTAEKDQCNASQALRKAILESGFSRPLLDRFEQVVHAAPASKDEFKKIVRLHLDRFITQVSNELKAQIEIENPTVFINFVAKNFFKPGGSNRAAIEITEQYVRTSLTTSIITNRKKMEPTGEPLYTLHFHKNQFTATLKYKANCIDHLTKKRKPN